MQSATKTHFLHATHHRQRLRAVVIFVHTIGRLLAVSEARCEQVHWNPHFLFLAAQETDLTEICEISQLFLYLLRKRDETFSGLLTFRLCYSFSSAVRGFDANNSRFYLFIVWTLVMHCHQLSTITDITEVQDHVSCQRHRSVGNKIMGKC